MDVEGDAETNVADTCDVVDGAMHDTNDVDDYLEDNIAEVSASSDVDMNATKDVQLEAAKNASSNASTLATEDPNKDADKSTRELTDLYSVLAQEGAPSQEPSPVKTA